MSPNLNVQRNIPSGEELNTNNNNIKDLANPGCALEHTLGPGTAILQPTDNLSFMPGVSNGLGTFSIQVRHCNVKENRPSPDEDSDLHHSLEPRIKRAGKDIPNNSVTSYVCSSSCESEKDSLRSNSVYVNDTSPRLISSCDFIQCDNV